MDRTAILSDGIEECQFRLTLCGFGPFFLFYGGYFVEAPLVAATEVGGGQENLHHGNGRFAGDDAAAKREHVRIVVFPRQACCIESCANAARTPGTLLAAMEMPIPVPQTA